MVGRTEERLVRKNSVKREGSGEQGLWEERAKGGEKKWWARGRGVERKNGGKKRGECDEKKW
jgi:hypothetical protein